jgi:hypothetical protein
VAKIGEIPALLVALGANVIVFMGIGLSPNVVVLGALLAVNGFLTMLWNIVVISVRQQVVPSDLLSRVNSVYKMIGWGLIPVGALTGGVVAHAFGLRTPYLIAGAVRGVALLVALPGLLRVMRSSSLQGGPVAGT